ncbi:MAG: Rne/Rng family ribonuclease [Proteobacteria bacterium]|nr:Rne/Rng family ribonuclease [Pseudomonadota bacterium]
MSRVMLINGQQQEELRVAVVADGTLESYQIEIAEAGLKRGNIYRGVVARVEPSLAAAFVDFGDEKHGFLTAHDIVPSAYHRAPPEGGKAPSVDQVLQKGRSVIVQVTRDAVGTKGATLTTNLSLPGRCLVLLPFDPSCGVSRKVEDEEQRAQLKDKAKSLALPEGYGCIVRTNAADETKTALKADLALLVRQAKRIFAEAERGTGPSLLYDDQDLVVQALRDYLDTGIEELVVDETGLFEKARDYVAETLPRSKLKVTAYHGVVPLFSRYNLEGQIESIYKRSVPLPGGGSIVIDHTEALTAIDVNSGKNTRGSTQGETAFTTNQAAVKEVARQLRLRDIGGLVVVDLIDMRARKHVQTVEKELRDALKADKARSHVGRISDNGLIEINRQRLKQALGQRMHRPCPTCQGSGMLPSPELIGLRLLRRIEARAATGRLRRVRVGLHPEIADAIQNRRRRQLAALELKFGLEIEVVAAGHLHRADEELEWTQREGPAWSGAGEGGEAAAEGSARPASTTPARPPQPSKAPARTERPAHERPAHERPAHERPAHERPAHERPATPARERPEAARAATPARAPGNAAPGAAPPSEAGPASEGDENGAARRRRRRRRGGRRRRGAGTGVNGEGGGLAATPSQEQALDAGDDDGGSDDRDETATPQQAAPAARERAAAKGAPTEGLAAEGAAFEGRATGSSAVEGAAAERAPRRERRRRERRPDAEGTAPEGTAPDATAAGAGARAEAASAPSGAESNAEGGAEGSAEASPTGAAAGPAGEGPGRSRRRSRRRPSRRRGEGEAASGPTDAIGPADAMPPVNEGD